MSVSRGVLGIAGAVAVGAGLLAGYVSAPAVDAQPVAAASSAPSSAPAPSGGASSAPASEASADEDSSYTNSVMAPDIVEGETVNGVTISSRIKTRDPVFFLTIDDGWSKQPEALEYVRANKIPVTSFLTEDSVGGDWDYFRELSAFDAVQNHSMTHKALSKETTNLDYEICEAQKIYKAQYGEAPWILRPPYGAGFMPVRSAAAKIEKTAASCGIKHIALWNVTVSKQGKVEFAGNQYQKGDIVLFHFEGDLKANLKKMVDAYAKKGLRPASLSQYLAK